MRNIKDYNMKLLILLLAAALLQISCGRGSGPPAGRRPAREQVAVPVVVEEVRLRDLEEHIIISGRLEGVTDITMMSETSGRVLSIAKNLGDRIEEGEELGKIDNEVYLIRLNQAKAALAAAEAGLETAKMNYRSAKQLFESETVSQGEYQQSLFAYQGAVAQRDGAAAALESSRKAFDNSRLIAPVSGYISSLNLKVGESIFPNVPIAGIINYEKLLLKTGISESNITKVRTGQSALITHNGFEFKGKVRGVGLKPSPNTSSYPVEILIENRNAMLVPGMVVRAKIRTDIHRNVIYTESGVISTRYDDHFVFTVNEQDEAVMTIIKPGRVVNEFTFIDEGLPLGSLIVVQGQDSLEDGMKVNVRN